MSFLKFTQPVQTKLWQYTQSFGDDFSDIQKEHAEKIEGLARVYEGSKGETANGYWLCSVTTVNDVASTITPAWPELFSQEAEVTSENIKILSAADTVLSFYTADTISVFDRGGDRATLIYAFLENDKAFIIRQTGKRHLVYNGEEKSLKAISRKAKFRWTFKVERIHKNKIKRRMYNCGAVPVEMPNDCGHRWLWLGVNNRHGGGFCWLLCYFKECASVKQGVALAIKGYDRRWKIEEVHRQIKVDYQLETICLLRYEALKTMNAFLWMAVSFLYTHLESLALDITGPCQPKEDQRPPVSKKALTFRLKNVYCHCSNQRASSLDPLSMFFVAYSVLDDIRCRLDRAP